MLARKVGTRIRQLREARKLSQAGLARRARVGRMTIVRIERGDQDPSLGTLQRIAKALRVKVRDLLPG